VPFDTRIVAATNRVLEDEVYEGRFREDLYYRLNVVRIDVAPLRERDGDVPVLARHFISGFAASSGRPMPELSPAAISRLIAYDWPGNVRELENSMERAIALARGATIEEDDLPEKIRNFTPKTFAVQAEDESEIVPIAELEKQYMSRVLTLLNGNKSRAAQVLGIDRRTLYRKLDAWKAAEDRRP
jgi:two-component system response regulator HydG